jgi:hypothetical protein
VTMSAEPCLCRGPLAKIYRACPRHGEVGDEFFALKEANVRLVEERNHWIRLFNRLDAAVSKHRSMKSASLIPADEHDEALDAAHDRILKEAATHEEAAEARRVEAHSTKKDVAGGA